MSAPIFVDTNVFVYALQPHEVLKQPLAMQWLERLWRDQLGRTSTQVINELYYTLTRKIDPKMAADEAWQHAQTLFGWNPQPVDKDLILRARGIEQRYRLSWWDSLIVSAAQLQNCAIVLSEDMQDRAVYGGVTVRNPFTLGVSEAPLVYTVTPQVMSRHRGRGRPRRASVA